MSRRREVDGVAGVDKQRVRTSTTIDRRCGRIPMQRIVAATTVETVGAPGAVERVVTTSPKERFGRGGTREGLILQRRDRDLDGGSTAIERAVIGMIGKA